MSVSIRLATLEDAETLLAIYAPLCDRYCGNF